MKKQKKSNQKCKQKNNAKQPWHQKAECQAKQGHQRASAADEQARIKTERLKQWIMPFAIEWRYFLENTQHKQQTTHIYHLHAQCNNNAATNTNATIDYKNFNTEKQFKHVTEKKGQTVPRFRWLFD